jgi:hypothetical protein
VGIKPS